MGRSIEYSHVLLLCPFSGSKRSWAPWISNVQRKSRSCSQYLLTCHNVWFSSGLPVASVIASGVLHVRALRIELSSRQAGHELPRLSLLKSLRTQAPTHIQSDRQTDRETDRFFMWNTQIYLKAHWFTKDELQVTDDVAHIRHYKFYYCRNIYFSHRFRKGRYSMRIHVTQRKDDIETVINRPRLMPNLWN